MNEKRVICAGSTPASVYASEYLKKAGWTVLSSIGSDSPFVLLDVPSLGPGRITDPEVLVESLNKDTIIYGGKLDHPAFKGFRTADLLLDPSYLALNAKITAHCAIQTAFPLLKCIWDGLPVLIIGWGRIGKCLAQKLKALGAKVTVSARKEVDLAMLHALDFHPVHISMLHSIAGEFRLIFNTVPDMVLDCTCAKVSTDCILIDLASVDGIRGTGVIRARGLPGIHAPESSGKLIADTFLRLVREELS